MVISGALDFIAEQLLEEETYIPLMKGIGAGVPLTDITLQIPSTEKFRSHFNWKPKKKMDDIWNDLLEYWRGIV